MPAEKQPFPRPVQPPASLVCGRVMTIAAENYYPAEYQGRIIYFCTEFCLEAFRADPDRFYSAHSRRKDPRLGNGQT
jgi:YHS domain-containing protein